MLITMVQIPASYLIPSPRYSGMPSLIPRPSSRHLHRQPSPFHSLTPPLPPITISPTHPSSPTHHRLTMHSPLLSHPSPSHPLTPPLPPITVSPCTHPSSPTHHRLTMHSPLLSHPSPSHHALTPPLPPITISPCTHHPVPRSPGRWLTLPDG